MQSYGGSSQQAIVKFIEANFAPTGNYKVYIRQALKKGVEKGNLVVFGPKEHGGSYIQNIKTKEKVEMEEENGTYMLNVTYLTDKSNLGFLRQP